MALHLKGSTQKLTLTTSAAGTIRFFGSYIDAPNPLTPSSNLTPDAITVPAVITTATTVDMIAAAAASTTRNVKAWYVFNEDASISQNITVSVVDSGPVLTEDHAARIASASRAAIAVAVAVNTGKTRKLKP